MPAQDTRDADAWGLFSLTGQPAPGGRADGDREWWDCMLCLPNEAGNVETPRDPKVAGVELLSHNAASSNTPAALGHNTSFKSNKSAASWHSGGSEGDSKDSKAPTVPRRGSLDRAHSFQTKPHIREMAKHEKTRKNAEQLMYQKRDELQKVAEELAKKQHDYKQKLGNADTMRDPTWAEKERLIKAEHSKLQTKQESLRNEISQLRSEMTNASDHHSRLSNARDEVKASGAVAMFRHKPGDSFKGSQSRKTGSI